jgi:sterol desaturase/sphingolipid hydroxylase (fatty acid hydroxylase superfamily)
MSFELPSPSAAATSSAGTIASILAAMGIVALLEAAIPLHARGRWSRAHLGPNLALTFITFATNACFGAALVMALVALESRGLGLFRRLSLPPLASGALAVLMLDLSFYVAHVCMHKLPAFWRFHRVHHSDPAVDVTTTIRQHPGESVIRYAFLAAAAIALGASPGAFAVYRAWVALNGLLEHANLRAPLWLDRWLSLVTTWPHMHKVHHSRVASETDTNYGNLFSLWDRLFSTFTPSRRGVAVAYGLDGLDDPVTQTAVGLLALPFRRVRDSSAAGGVGASRPGPGSRSAGRPAVEVPGSEHATTFGGGSSSARGA